MRGLGSPPAADHRGDLGDGTSYKSADRPLHRPDPPRRASLADDGRKNRYDIPELFRTEEHTASTTRLTS